VGWLARLRPWLLSWGMPKFFDLPPLKMSWNEAKLHIIHFFLFESNSAKHTSALCRKVGISPL